VAIEVAAGFDVAFGFEFALGFAASVPQSIGRCRSFSKPPLGLFARPSKANNLAHPAPDEPSGVIPSSRGFGGKCAYSVAAWPLVSSRPTRRDGKMSGDVRFDWHLLAVTHKLISIQLIDYSKCLLSRHEY
jgi:hypothetical protein